MSLRRIFETLYAQAELSGEASQQLAQGAAVKVRAQGRRRQVILSRQGAPVGLVETTTFQAHGKIPDDAEGVCWLPTATGLYRVTFTWEIVPVAPSLFDLPAADAAPATIYTLGYGAGWSPAQIAAEVARLGAQLWDIRYQPWSKSPQWRGEALADLLGERYQHVRALGNQNYRGGPIELYRPAAAVEPARTALARGPIALLCGCKEATACHRSVAADFLAAQLGGVAIAHLEPPQPVDTGYRLPEVADLPGHL